METTLNIEYLTNKDGDVSAVVIPLELWRQLLLLNEEVSVDRLAGLELLKVSGV
ncbi:MAG: hypothetical protein ACM65L_08810 [Microcoleus sp.]